MVCPLQGMSSAADPEGEAWTGLYEAGWLDVTGERWATRYSSTSYSARHIVYRF